MFGTIIGFILAAAGLGGWVFLLLAFRFCIQELGQGM